MNYKGILRIIGVYFFLLSFLCGIGFFVSLYFSLFGANPEYYPNEPVVPFLEITFACILIGTFLKFVTKNETKAIFLREGILSVISIWLITALVGAFPFFLSGTISSFTDSFFESVSGITTTGSTIIHSKEYDKNGREIPIQLTLTEFQKITYTFYGTVAPIIDPASNTIEKYGVEALPHGLIFWRVFLQYIGGLGMVILFIALLPLLGQQGSVLFRYESTGPMFVPLFPQIRQTAFVLISTYLLLSFFCVLSLLWANKELPLFDACTLSLATISTGGFCGKNGSIGAYNSASMEIVIMIFMVLGSLNFCIYYYLYKGKLWRLLQPEYLMFFFTLLISCMLVSFDLYGTKKFLLVDSPENGKATYNAVESMRYGFFQVISSMSSTGFATANYDNWPFFTQSMMLVTMFMGGMAGSTAGGIKSIRLCILLLVSGYAVQSLFRTNEVKVLRLGTREIDSKTTIGVLCFFLLMVLSALIGLLLLVLNGVDLETSLGLSACMINDTGASFRAAGPLQSCAFLSDFGKSICIIWMFLGRLEFYIFFVLFLPTFWKVK